MSIARHIIFLDDMRKLCKESFDIWRNNQKTTKDREFAKYCKSESEDAYKKYLAYRSLLTKIGVTAGDHNWQQDIKL